ncbi:MAG: DUF4281 domain-containing protein [Aureispira sp.]|nr:DUF4281 domain-containing protein [Aureispira sp.]
MSTELIFSICNNGVLIPWLMLILLPTWKWTERLVLRWQVFPLLLAIVYLVLTLIDVFSGKGGGADFTSFESIKSMFMREEVVLVGWIHYLVFDLFVGTWELKEAQRLKIPHWWLVPCLLLTLLLGPIGFLLFCGLRSVYLPKEGIA